MDRVFNKGFELCFFMGTGHALKIVCGCPQKTLGTHDSLPIREFDRTNERMMYLCLVGRIQKEVPVRIHMMIFWLMGFTLIRASALQKEQRA